MKKILCLLTVTAAIMALVCACGASKNNDETTIYTTAATTAQTKITEATGTTAATTAETEKSAVTEEITTAQQTTASQTTVATTATIAQTTAQTTATVITTVAVTTSATEHTTAATTAKPIAAGSLKWEEFYVLSSAEKDEYKNSFNGMDEFYEWYIDAQAQFKIDYPDIEIGPDGTIDLSKLK